MFHTFRQDSPDSLRVWAWGPLDLPKTVEGIEGIPEQSPGIPEDRMHEMFSATVRSEQVNVVLSQNGGGRYSFTPPVEKSALQISPFKRNFEVRTLLDQDL